MVDIAHSGKGTLLDLMSVTFISHLRRLGAGVCGLLTEVKLVCCFAGGEVCETEQEVQSRQVLLGDGDDAPRVIEQKKLC